MFKGAKQFNLNLKIAGEYQMFDGEEVSEAVALADPKKLLAFYASSVEHPEFHFERDIEIIKSV